MYYGKGVDRCWSSEVISSNASLGIMRDGRGNGNLSFHVVSFFANCPLAFSTYFSISRKFLSVSMLAFCANCNKNAFCIILSNLFSFTLIIVIEFLSFRVFCISKNTNLRKTEIFIGNDTFFGSISRVPICFLKQGVASPKRCLV